jgi:hypothetical protein
MKLRSLLLPFTALVPLLSGFAVDLPAQKDFHLFILAGQSNMAGRGKLDDEARQPQPRVFSLNKESQWQPAVDPLHWDKGSAGTGVGKPFGEIVAAKFPGISVGLVPTACGGSPISVWVPGASFAQTRSNPWDDAIARTKRAMQDGTVKAILWHQGESDATPKDAGQYEQRLTDLINRFRAELGTPDLPFIIGQLGRFPAHPWTADTETVNAAQQAVAKKLKNVRFVPVPETTNSIGDNVHFDTPSLRAFAKGYAEAYFELAGGAKP